MKKILALSALALIFAYSAPLVSQAAFTGPGPALTSVIKAKEMHDDTPVTLQGNIVKQLSNKKYEFHDATGSITIEIDDNKWGGLDISPSDKVEITGEVDKGRNKLEIEVDSIRKL